MDDLTNNNVESLDEYSEISENTRSKVKQVLNAAYEQAERVFLGEFTISWQLNSTFTSALDAMNSAASKAATGFTNVMTGLAIKVAMPHIDTRYHQVQIQNPKYFNFRSISESVVYPWLNDKDFEGSKSGWQTRTFERPKPYLLSFDENIQYVKEPFLICYDQMQKPENVPADALVYLLLGQIQRRENTKIDLARPAITDIARILKYLETHVHFQYKGKGASRLPVLMIHATYAVMMNEVKRYSNKKLRPLESHSAADIRTGSSGDIEIENSDNSLFEGVEIKHNIKITEDMINDVGRKIAYYSPSRYYILTTHKNCKPDESMQILLREIKERMGYQIIVNGVLPTIQYYLRLLENPGAIFVPYTTLLADDKALSHQHRVIWNDIVTGRVST